MQHRGRLLLSLLLAAATAAATTAGATADAAAAATAADAATPGGTGGPGPGTGGTLAAGEDVVERNPYYIGDDNEDGSSRDARRRRRRSRAEVDAALARAPGRPARSPLRRRLRRAAKAVRRHRLQILAAVGLFAFRREIGALVWRLASTPVRDGATGESHRRPNLTALLKALVVVSLLRQLQQRQSQGDGGPASPAGLLLLTLGRGGNPIASLLLSALLSPAHRAYLPPVQQHFTFERLNERYERDGAALQRAVGADGVRPTKSLVQLLSPGPVDAGHNGTMIVMDLTGLDASLHQLDTLRDSVSFLLSRHGVSSLVEQAPASDRKPPPRSGDDADADSNEAPPSSLPQVEVVVLLESPGGAPSEYALAAQQVLRLRNHGLLVTVCVDKVAASGGYMIACTSSPGHLFAAPFAILGSIGVVGQVVNVHKTLKNWGVDPLVFRAGKDKAPLSVIGEVTTEGISAVQNIVDNTHRAFKRHVIESRPVLSDSIEHIATGDIWLGHDAFHQGLIDRVITSDEYLAERIAKGVRALKLVRLNASKYPFFRPTVAGGLTTTRPALRQILLSHMQRLLDQWSSRLQDVLQSNRAHFETTDRDTDGAMFR